MRVVTAYPFSVLLEPTLNVSRNAGIDRFVFALKEVEEIHGNLAIQ